MEDRHLELALVLTGTASRWLFRYILSEPAKLGSTVVICIWMFCNNAFPGVGILRSKLLPVLACRGSLAILFDRGRYRARHGRRCLGVSAIRNVWPLFHLRHLGELDAVTGFRHVGQNARLCRFRDALARCDRQTSERVVRSRQPRKCFSDGGQNSGRCSRV